MKLIKTILIIAAVYVASNFILKGAGICPKYINRMPTIVHDSYNGVGISMGQGFNLCQLVFYPLTPKVY